MSSQQFVAPAQAAVAQSAATPVSAPPPSGDKKKRPRGNRGKPSAQKHDESFRTRTGEQVLKEERAKRQARTFSEIDEVVEQLKNLYINDTPITVQLPVTTRGLGLLVNEAYDSITLLQKGKAPVITKNQYYRVVLAQFHLQQQKAIREQSGSNCEVLIDGQSFSTPTINFDQTVSSHSRNIRPIAAVINSCGNFELNGTRYAPVVPVSGIESNSATASTPVSPKRARSTDYGPDPYVVTFSNLRQTVEALADRTTPQPVRAYFRENNPLPSAKWSDEDLLLNADEIMPPGYTDLQLSRELRMLSALCDSLAGKHSQLVSQLNYDGRGNVAALVTQNDSYRIEGDYVQGEQEMFWALEPNLQGYSVLGALTLLGEAPNYFHDRTNSETYLLRSQLAQKMKVPATWVQVVGKALQPSRLN